MKAPRLTLILLLLLCVNTAFLMLALAYYSSTIQGSSPLIYAGAIPNTFIEGEIELNLTGEKSYVLDLPSYGIGGYDIYKIKFSGLNFTPSYENFTDSWNGWVLDRAEIENYGVDERDKKIGNSSLWFDVKPSNISNTWIRYGNGNQSLDLSGYNALVLYVKSNVTLSWQYARGGGTSIILRTGKSDPTLKGYFLYNMNITTSWQKLVIPFSDFEVDINPSISEIDFLYISTFASQGSQSYRIWIDGLAFTSIERSLVYCNGVLVPFTLGSSEAEVQNVWIAGYGYGAKECFKDKIIIVKSGSFELEATLTLRLYPRSYRYYGYVNFTDMSGTVVDAYQWDNLTVITNKMHSIKVLISVPKDTLHIRLNEHVIQPDHNRSIVYLFTEKYPLEVVSMPITGEDNYTLEIYARKAWFLAPLHFMDKALVMLQPFKRGANYPMLLLYVLVSILEINIAIFYKIDAQIAKNEYKE